MDIIFKKMAEIPKDKLLHSFYGTLIFVVLTIIGTQSIIAFSVVIVIAILKELYDEYTYGGFDIIDILFTIFIPALFLIKYLI